MPTFDDLFGSPATDNISQPQDMLPAEPAISTGHNSGVRDVMLAASPFQQDAADFFNQDSSEVVVEATAGQPSFPQLPDSFGEPIVYAGSPSAVNQNQVDSGVDALTQALGPSIENISRFGEFGGGLAPSSNLSIDELREAVRAVLNRL